MQADIYLTIKNIKIPSVCVKWQSSDTMINIDQSIQPLLYNNTYKYTCHDR